MISENVYVDRYLFPHIMGEYSLGWSLSRLVWRIFFFFVRPMIFKTIKNMQNSNFWQRQHFLLQKKNFQVWPKQAIYGRTRKIISKTKKETYIVLYIDFDFWLQSHNATIKKV